jgi:hypothetical protein
VTPDEREGAANPQPEPIGDPLKLEIAEVALEMIEETGQARPEELLVRFPGCEPTVLAALRALGLYDEELARNRQRNKPRQETEWLSPGDVLGDFDIVEVIGRGNMGVVYRARQRSLGHRVVALKVLPPALVARDPRFLERFRREATLAAEVHDARLAEIYGFGEERGLLFFAMQLVEGRTLSDVLKSLAHLKQLGMPPHENESFVRSIVALVLLVAKASAALHQRGLVHRDIKPSNVILEGAAEDDLKALAQPPMLVDFGLLKPIEDSELTGSQTLLGTPAYAPPEARLGQRVDARADVFALGATLYALLSLTPADTRECDDEGTHCVRKLNAAVDERLDAIVRMALEANKLLRYADGHALASDLGRYLRNEPVLALPQTSLGRFRLWRRRYPERSLALILMGLLVAGVLSVTSFFVGGWAYPLYHAAGVASVLEADGDLLAAEQAWRPVFESRWAGWLPLLPGDLPRARACLGENGTLTEPLIKLRAKLDREAHQDLELVFAASFPEPPSGEILCLFAHEISSPETHEACRLEALATTARMYLSPRPRPHTVFPAGSPERRLFDALATTVRRESQADEPQVHLLENAVAALGGTKTLEALDLVIPLLAAADQELQRVAYAAAERLWWALRGEPDLSAGWPTYPDLLDFDEALWITWAENLDATDRKQLPAPEDLVPLPQAKWGFTINNGMRVFLANSVRSSASCIAWTRMELRDAGQLHDELWSHLPPDLVGYFDALEDLLRRSRRGEKPEIEAFHATPIASPVGTEQWEYWHRPFPNFYARWSSPHTGYSYPHEGSQAREAHAVQGAGQLPSPVSSVVFVESDELEKRVATKGAIEKVTWTGKLAPYKGWGTLLMLEGQGDKLSIDCLCPTLGSYTAKVEIAYDAPAFWPLPHTGGALLHVSVNGEELEVTRRGHADTEVLSFTVPRRALMLMPKMQLELDLLSNNWLWVYWVKITFEEASLESRRTYR